MAEQNDGGMRPDDASRQEQDRQQGLDQQQNRQNRDQGPGQDRDNAMDDGANEDAPNGTQGR